MSYYYRERETDINTIRRAVNDAFPLTDPPTNPPTHIHPTRDQINAAFPKKDLDSFIKRDEPFNKAINTLLDDTAINTDKDAATEIVIDKYTRMMKLKVYEDLYNSCFSGAKCPLIKYDIEDLKMELYGTSSLYQKTFGRIFGRTGLGGGKYRKTRRHKKRIGSRKRRGNGRKRN